MRIVRELDQRVLAGLFVALSVGIILLSLPATASAAPTGSSFNHIVIIAMENQNYGSVIGSSSAPFINSLAALGTTISNYHSYGQNINGCSAGCYEAFTSGQQSHSDSWCPRASSPCYTIPNIADQLHTAGLTSAMFCEDGCPRGADHFPWIAYTSTWNSCLAASGGVNCSGQTGPDGNLLYNSQSSGGNTAFINYLNSATPANYIWFTPTDSHNMHDNSVSTGDSYLQSLLVGTGTLSSPSSSSVLGSSLLKTPGTFLYLWWDEYDPSPNVEYGSMIKIGHTSTGGYTEYDSLHTIEANWGLPYITSVVSGDSGMTDIFGSITPPALSASFTALPATPLVNTLISFTGTASGGTSPYAYSWNFGDGATGSGLTTTHSYSTVGAYSVTLTVSDSASGSAKSMQTVNVSPIPALTPSFTFTPSQPTSGQTISFTGAATGGISPYAYSWNFGDGSTSTSQNPTHTYSTSGTFTASLNVTDTALTHALASQSITVSAPGALIASFNNSPTSPVSAQTITFTATVTGGTSPYTYSWNLGGTSKTGNPVSQSLTNGTYTISLTVTDSASKSVTTSQTLVVLPSAGSSTVPVLIGWGGIRLDEAAVGGGVSQPTNPPASLVFPSEKATNMELILIEMKAMGYNIVRVNFDPACTSSQYMSTYSATNLQRAIQIAQYFHFWILIDYHGYSEPFNSTQATCWLNFWSGVTNQFKNSYSQIIWEPLNEPCYDSSTCAGSSTTNDMCSGASACVTTLSHEYQLWISQTRAQGDTHWIVVQNICSYGCSLSNWATGFPTVTDPLGTLSQGGKIFISLHSYMGYSSGNWNNATADSMAQQYYQAVVSGISTAGWPALNTEGGADPLCTSCAPDQILTGSAGYTTVTFHFIQALTNLYDSNTPRINWIWWPAGSWTNTPGSGIYGAMQCASSPPGWGCLLKFLSLGPPQPDFAVAASNPGGLNVGQSASSTISMSAQNGFTGTVTLTDTPPAGLTCGTVSPSSISGSTTATVSCSSNVAGTYLLSVIGTSGALVHVTIATFNFQDFTVSATSPSAVAPGSSSVSTISLTAVNGFGGTITITDTVPSGLSCSSLSKSSITGSGTATLSCSSTTQNPYTVTISATSGAITHTSTASFTFGAPPDFTLSASSPSSVNVGSSTTSTITVSLINGFTNTLTLSTSVPSGLTCNSLSKTSFASSGTATVSCSSTIPATYSLTITGTSGSLVHTSTATFTFLATYIPPTVSVPSTETVNALATLTFTVSATDTSNPAPMLTISGSQLPTGASFSGGSGIAPSGTFTWTPTEAQTGTFTVTFTVTDGVTPVQGSVVITVVSSVQPLTLTLPTGPESATVGTALSFVVYAKNPAAPSDALNVTANGLAPNMAYDPSSGIFSFTPSQSQAGQTFVVNFTATDSANPAASGNKSVTIHVASAASSPSGGFCLDCVIPRGFSLTMWLFVVGGLIGVISSIALLNVRAHAELAGARRRHHDPTGVRHGHSAQNHSEKVRTIQHPYRNPSRSREEN